MTSNISFEKRTMFLGSATYLGRVSRYLSQVGEEREIEREMSKKKERKKGRREEGERSLGRMEESLTFTRGGEGRGNFKIHARENMNV